MTLTTETFKALHPTERNAEKNAREQKKKACSIPRINAPVVLEGVIAALYSHVFLKSRLQRHRTKINSTDDPFIQLRCE